MCSKNRNHILVKIILLLLLKLKCEARPKISSSSSSLSQDVVEYLSQFGYLRFSETEALMSETQIRDAVKNLQFFSGLNVTGEIDGKTRELMLKPRCGVPDVAHPGYRNKRGILRVKRYNLQGQRWSRTNLTWSLRLGPTNSRLDEAAVRRELSAALEMWSRQTRLTFTEVGQREGEADIQVFFQRHFHGDGYPFDGTGSVLAHAFFPGLGRGGDVHFDDDEYWTEERGLINRDSTSIFSVAVHEFGHSLGLSHSSVDGSIMFPWYGSNNAFERGLPKDDLDAIQHLYGRSHDFPYDFDDESGHVYNEVHSEQEENGDESSNNNDEEDSSGSLPDKCETNFDAVAVIRSEMWAFKGRYFWRIDRDGGSREDPIELSAFWYGLPSTVERVDAVYERPDHKIVFFVGKEFYILTGNSQLEAGPIPITRFGLPPELKKVDAAMRWGWNDRTYFFSDTMYWRYDDDLHTVELDYPRDISIWSGIPYDIDAAFRYTDGKTYFFKDKYFWEFDDMRMSVVNEEPTDIAEHWMRCPKEIKDPFQSEDSSISNSAPLTRVLNCVLLTVITIVTYSVTVLATS